MSAAVATRDLGPVRVSVVHTAAGRWTPSFPDSPDWRTPDTPVDDQDRALLGVNSLVIQTPAGTTVVDPGTFPPDDPAVDPGPPLDASLAALGVDPAAVRRVVVTHGHDEHFSGVVDDHGGLRFPNAEHVFPEADWDGLLSGDMYNAEVGVAQLRPVHDAGRLRLVSGDVDLGDGLELLHTPGETDGHHVVRLDAGGERVYYLGDLMHFPIEFQQLRWAVSPKPAAVGDELERSRIRILEDAAGSALVFTHGVFPAWGTADRSGAGWIWRYAS